MADSDDDSFMSESETDDEQAQIKRSNTKTLPVLAFSSILLKKKIRELSDISNTYNLYVINEDTPNNWNLYLFIQDPSGITQPIGLSNNEILRHIVTIQRNGTDQYSSTQYFLEQLLNATKDELGSIKDYTFHIKNEVKSQIQDLLNRYIIENPSASNIENFSCSISLVKNIQRNKNDDGISDTIFVNALKKVSTPGQQSQLYEYEYKYFTNRGGNDCFFLSLAQAYVKSKNENLKNQLKERMNLSNSTDIDTLQQDIRKFIASNVNDYQYQAFKQRENTVNAQMRNRVNSLEDYQNEIKSSAYQADELTINILIENKIFPFSVELNTENTNAIVKCTSYLDKPSLQTLEQDYLTDSSGNSDLMIYFMLRYTPSNDQDSNHYELVAYEKFPSKLKTLFLYNQLPDPIKTLVQNKCKRPN